MNRKGLIALICIMSVMIFMLVLILFVDIFKDNNPQTAPESSQQTNVNQQMETPTQQQPTEQQDDQSEESNEQSTDPSDTNEITDDSQDKEQTENKEENEDNKEPEDSKKPEDNKEPEDNKKPESSKESEDKKEPPVSNVSIPKSYKDFSLVKGKSAKEAYDILNDFLNSKYSILINKQHKVGSDYAPSNLIVPSGYSYKLESTAANAMVKMLNAARSDGITDLVFCSGYRTYSSQSSKFSNRTQQYLNKGYSKSEAEKKAGEYIAPPGSSEHHTGLAADICSNAIISRYGQLTDDFDTTKEWRWLNSHCSEYGFILRYRKNAESITGFSYEPWHFRYLGIDHAKACTELNITYEEYYDMITRFRSQAKADAGV